jgi:glycosyltransferase involved in cell wall biosynthesis
VYALSGVAEESFRIAPPGTLRVLARGSSHIRVQARILADEERRTGTRLDRPSRWMIGREEREYGLADRIVTLSTFARQTFEAEGEPAAKLWLLPPAADVATFHPPPELVAARCRRILGGEPLRVLNVGALSLRKGLWDMRAIIAGLPDGRFEFRFVGPVTREATGLVRALRGAAAFVPKQPEAGLPAAYGWGDVFVLPTIEDGFAVVLSQAAASALPILTTPNGAGADLVREGETGWVLPIRSPAAFVERLAWCDAHRVEVASMVQAAHRAPRSHDWSQVAGDFEARCRAHRTADPVSGRAETRA